MSSRDIDASLAKPYKGPQSYQSHDAGLFYGREAEADLLLSKILSSQFSLLHAQSGAGKTSLLNARIIPRLEQRGWCPVRILPQNDPIESTWLSTLQSLLPPPAAEALAVERAVSALANGQDLTLSELLKRYDDLPPRDAVKRFLIEPLCLDLDGLDRYKKWLGGGHVTPYFCRLLRATLEVKGLNDHFRLFVKGSDEFDALPITGKTPMSQILGLCQSGRMADGYAALLSELEAKNALWGLLEKFENLFNVFSERRNALKLALVFDQFEELFTRFVDPGQLKQEAEDIPDWRLRWLFFDELRSLYFRGYGDAPSSNEESDAGRKPALPIRYVVSMRSEWICRLEGISRFARDIVASGYHLDFLVKETARQAIKEPARVYGFGYEDSLYDKIIDDLSKELRYVEPTHLQIVCEKLWDARGRELADIDGGLAGSTTASPHTHCALVELTVYQQLDGAAGILKAFLLDYLDSLKADDKLASVEMLESLVTISGTRNIVDQVQLINSPFRKSDDEEVSEAGRSLGWSSEFIQRRKKCLADLINRNIVRMESRLGGQFVEITHEFLIEPIRKEVARQLYSNLGYRNFRQALHVLSHCEAMSLGIDMDRDFGEADFYAVNAYSNLITWSPWACELMLRRAIEYGSAKDVISQWLERFQNLPDTGDPWQAAKAQLNLIEQERRYDLSLGRRQLGFINSQKDRLKTLSPGEVEVIFRSLLKHGRDADRGDIEFWSGRLYEQQSA